jgi:hypothetical protein
MISAKEARQITINEYIDDLMDFFDQEIRKYAQKRKYCLELIWPAREASEWNKNGQLDMAIRDLRDFGFTVTYTVDVSCYLTISWE